MKKPSFAKTAFNLTTKNYDKTLRLGVAFLELYQLGVDVFKERCLAVWDCSPLAGNPYR